MAYSHSAANSYGDKTPGTEQERLFTVFYVLYGFVVLCVIGLTLSDVLHHSMEEHDDIRAQRALSMITSAKFDSAAKSAS